MSDKTKFVVTKTSKDYIGWSPWYGWQHLVNENTEEDIRDYQPHPDAKLERVLAEKEGGGTGETWAWTLELGLPDLLALIRATDSSKAVINFKTDYELPVLEIYDTYRE